jgi:hypothetical protein
MLRAGGAKLERKDLIDRVEQALRDAHFSQVPQLEGPTDQGALFGSSRVGEGKSNNTLPAMVTPGGLDELKDIIPLIALLAPDAQVEALRLLESRGGLQPKAPLRSVGDRLLVYVHGICKHEAGYSNSWWEALHPFTNTFGAGRLDDKRREVLWSDLVNQRALEAQANRAVDERAARQADEQEQLKEAILEALRDRSDRQMIDTRPMLGEDDAPRAIEESRALTIPGLNCIDDFTIYMVNDSVRAEVIGCFTRVVRPLLESGAELDIISHSWGTVVAYEALRELASQGVNAGRVRNFFTVGAALSIGPVKAKLRTANKDGQRPAMVRRWVNLDARGDVVGGSLKGRPYAVDKEFLNLNPFGCTQFLGIFDPGCAHGSYFVSHNKPVNRDIFAAFIAQA